MCAQIRPRFILSSERFFGNGVRTHVNSKGKNPVYRRLRGGSNPRRCITKDSEPNALLTELFRLPLPPSRIVHAVEWSLERLSRSRLSQNDSVSFPPLLVIVY